MNKIMFSEIVFVVLLPVFTFTQPNCNAFLMAGDSCRYKACKYIEDSPNYFQLSKEFHQVYDSAIEICSEYSQAYRAKSTAYLKTGDFMSWKLLMDRAVEIDPKQHLDYRGWCRFQFLRDYQGAIEDIETLQSLSGPEIGFSENGFYHLKTVKALCYKMIGQKEKAIQLMQERIIEDASHFELYNHYHLGVLYYEQARFEEAIESFNKQSQINELAENQYYKALSQRGKGDFSGSKQSLQKAKELYSEYKFMFDPYTHQVDKVYLQEIEETIEVFASDTRSEPTNG